MPYSSALPLAEIFTTNPSRTPLNVARYALFVGKVRGVRVARHVRFARSVHRDRLGEIEVIASEIG